MAANNEISAGMTFDEIIASGQTPELYSSLTWNGIDQIELDMRKGTASDFNTLYTQLATSNPGASQDNIVDAICSLVDQWSKSVDNTINADLNAQAAARQSADTITLASQLEPAEGFDSSPEFLKLVVADEHKDIFKAAVNEEE